MSAKSTIQYVSDDLGNVVAVIVPIELWREIESERETAYLLKSEAMRQRLIEAKNRTEGISSESLREAARLRDAILQGYDDAITGRTVPFTGNLREAMDALKD